MAGEAGCWQRQQGWSVKAAVVKSLEWEGRVPSKGHLVSLKTRWLQRYQKTVE